MIADRFYKTFFFKNDRYYFLQVQNENVFKNLYL